MDENWLRRAQSLRAGRALPVRLPVLVRNTEAPNEGIYTMNEVMRVDIQFVRGDEPPRVCELLRIVPSSANPNGEPTGVAPEALAGQCEA